MRTSADSNFGLRPPLVLGATGKTGRRVVAQLEARGVKPRLGSRRATLPFDWEDCSTWEAPLEGVGAVYLALASELAGPGSAERIEKFARFASSHGVERVVLICGRGEEDALEWEATIAEYFGRWTVVRASWFNQNFSEGIFLNMVRRGYIELPAGAVPEPFVDVEDIAAVATAALLGDGHDQQIYEVTGPRLLTFADIALELTRCMGRTIEFRDVPLDLYCERFADSGAVPEEVAVMRHLFGTVLDGRNAHLGDGVERALGRVPRDFSQFARDVAAGPEWRVSA